MRATRRGVLFSSLLFGAWATAGAVRAQTFEIYHSFVYPSGSPHGPVVKAPDGTLYGTTEQGGAFAKGSVYSMTPNSSGLFDFATLHSFVGADGAAPRSALVFGPDGNLYGTTSGGGAAGAGTLFRITPSGALTRIHDFADGGGQEPTEVVFASDGALWGTTKSGGDHGGGTLYRLAAGDVFSVVHHFDGAVEGAAPVGGLLPLGALLYGTASAGGSGGFGTVFRSDLAGNVTTIHHFAGTDGSAPLAALILGTDGNLYGTTSQGGNAGGYGTIFRMTSSGTITTLHSFDFLNDGATPSAPLLQWTDGRLYGTTAAGGGPIPPPPGGAPTGPLGGPPPAGTVFRIDTLGNFQKLYSFTSPPYLQADQGVPLSGLVDGGFGFLYGTTWKSFGTIYRIVLAGDLGYVHKFGSDQGAVAPIGKLAELGGKIYGTGDALLNSGTVFSIDSGNATVLYTLGAPFDGRYPKGLLAASDGALYGVTSESNGTIFRFTPPATYETIHKFLLDGTEGSMPLAGLIEYASGDLYGTTAHGGGPVGNGLGTVFHITTAGAFESLHTFDGPDGFQPGAELVPTGDGGFYGTTVGSGFGGNIFSMDTLGTVTDVHDFVGTDGSTPQGGLLHASDGNFYGVTAGGGANNAGVFYRLDGTGTVTPLHDFTAAEGLGPVGSLVQASDALLYGVALGGGSQGDGTLFSVDLLGSVGLSHEFSGPDGRNPNAGLLVASDGAVYGTTYYGGFSGGGIVFRWWPSAVSPALAAIAPASGPASGGTPVVVTGDHLSGITGVSIGGVAATPPTLPDQGHAYSVSPALTPGTLNDVAVQAPAGRPARPAQTLTAAWFADFSDVAGDDIFHAYVETIFRAGITAGCGGGAYCRNDAVRRDQMAVFLLKAEHGSGYAPPACGGTFPDVTCPGLFADWIEQLATEGVTAGCGGGNYCPLAPVTRAQMAVFLLKTKEGSGYAPPPATGIFGDVPAADSFAPWIEELYNRQITGGCQASPLLYCPGSANTRGQMAVFLTKTFNLQ